MKLKQDTKIIINGKETQAIPFQDIRHARRWTKEQEQTESIKVMRYGNYSWDIYYLETGNILKVRFY